MAILIFRMLLATSVLTSFGIQIGYACNKKPQPDWLDTWVTLNSGMCLADLVHLVLGGVS